MSNIFKNELYNLYYEAKNGFIYNKGNNKQKNSYLCIARDYSFDIIDLYDKECIKSIRGDFNKSLPIHQWSNKYVIAIEGYSWEREKILKIIDLENNKVISKIEEEHTNKIMYIKKILYPIYGESLLTAQENGTIKLWVI